MKNDLREKLEAVIAEAATKIIYSRIVGKVQKDPEKRALMGVHYYSTNTPEEQADLIVRMARPKLQALLTQEKLALLDEVMGKVESKQFWAADDAYDAGDVVAIDDVRQALQAIRDSVSGGK